MKFGDLISLFQLGVALNIGFGALISFVEPAKRRRDNLIYAIKSELITLSARHENETPGDDEIEDVFDIARKYRRLFLPSLFLNVETLFWEGLFTRAVFFVCGVLSFGGLALASARANNTAPPITILISIALNVSSFVAFLLLGISFWYNHRVFPVIDELQGRLFKYKVYLTPSNKADSANRDQSA